MRGGGVSREDLIPFNARTKDEQKKIASAGGKASGEARRRKKSLREAAELYLSLPVTDRRSWNKLARREIDPEDIDNQMAMIVGLTDAAVLGDARAGRLIVDILGEQPREPDGLDAARELLEGVDSAID